MKGKSAVRSRKEPRCAGEGRWGWQPVAETQASHLGWACSKAHGLCSCLQRVEERPEHSGCFNAHFGD